jgi:hypothetical protein
VVCVGVVVAGGVVSAVVGQARSFDPAEPSVVLEAPGSVMGRPGCAPRGVLGSLPSWERRAWRGVFSLPVRSDAAWLAGQAALAVCQRWGLAQLGEAMAAGAGELVAAAVRAAMRRTARSQESAAYVEMTLSLALECVVVEVCDPDPRLPQTGTGADPDLLAVQARVARLGGEFGCVAGAVGKSVFFALPVHTPVRSGSGTRESGMPGGAR